MTEQGGAAPASLPPLVAVTANVSAQPEQLFMATSNQGGLSSKTASLFYSAAGALAYRVENSPGLLFEKKTLYDGHGKLLLNCKKSPLSLAKWTISRPDGTVVATTKTVPGLAKYGVEVYVPSRSGSSPTFLVTPDASLRHVIIRQIDGNGKQRQERLVCDAAFGPTVIMGWMSTLAQNWSYLLALEPGADAALSAVVLVMFTDLLEWESMQAMM